MSKIVDKERLDKAAKALNKIIKDSINNERERAIAAEDLLETAIENTTQMFGGKSIKYVTQEQFNAMTEEEQNNPTITYFIIDAEDLSHTHNNKDLLDNFGARTLTVGNSGKTFDGSENLSWTLNEIGAAPVEHIHDDKYYTETEIDGKIEDINESINEQVAEITGLLEVLNGTKLDTNVATTHFIQSALSQEGESYDSHTLFKGEKIISPLVNTNTVIDDDGTTLTAYLSYFDTSINSISAAIGNGDQLLTDAKDSVVNCINELQTEINDLENDKADRSELFSGDYNDLTNKPCYDTREYGEVNYSYDGNPEGKETVYDGWYIKIAECNYENLSDIKSIEIEVSGEIRSYFTKDCVIIGDSVSTPNGDSVIVLKDKEIYGIPSGIWVTEDVTNVKLEAVVSGELKPLDIKLIPDMAGRRLDGQTFDVKKSYHDEEYETITANYNAEAFNSDKNIAVGENSHAEGIETVARGGASHAEGTYTYANGDTSHAEGYFSVANGMASHAEGMNTIAEGSLSHAEGSKSVANGWCSHAEGESTIASGDVQHVQGQYNIEDTEGIYAHIVGNGSSYYDGASGTDVENRSNAHTLDWSGNAWFQGNVSVDGTPTNDNDLTTKKYVDDQINTSLNNLKLIQMTQAEYDALTTKEPNTLYIITE